MNQIFAHACEAMPELSDDSVALTVTSPPYWNAIDYATHAADKRENRYYDPKTTTKEDGTFELRFVRPGEQYIQAAPFWLFAEEAPADTTKRLKLTAGQTVEGVTLTARDGG